MEAATAVVMRQAPLRFSSSCSMEVRASVFVGRRRGTRRVMFCDQGHLQYYCLPKNSSLAIRSGEAVKEKGSVKKVMKEKKKQLKLLKGLSKDLSSFSMMGYGLDSDRALVDQIKGNSISEAAELLLEQLNRIRAQEKELKRKAKEEKARLKAAAKMQDTSSSSSSSSESSDNDCGEVINMKKPKNVQPKPNSVQQVIEEQPSSSLTSPVIPTITPLQPDTAEQEPTLQSTSSTSAESSCCSEASTTSTSGEAIANFTEDGAGSVVSMTSSKKIEVCMGGKCKKSGAGALLDEFQRVVGIEGAVSGCKCMGKCRDAPNVKVQSGDSEKSVRAPVSSLCLGVGLEDVELIVANLLGGDNDNQLGFATVS